MKEDWIKGMDAGKEWIPQLRDELVKEKGNGAIFLIPICLKAIINLERRVYELERAEKIRKGDL